MVVKINIHSNGKKKIQLNINKRLNLCCYFTSRVLPVID